MAIEKFKARQDFIITQLPIDGLISHKLADDSIILLTHPTDNQWNVIKIVHDPLSITGINSDTCWWKEFNLLEEAREEYWRYG